MKKILIKYWYIPIIIIAAIGIYFLIVDFPESYYDSNISNNMKEFNFIADKRKDIIIGILVILGGGLTIWRSFELKRQNDINEKNNDNNLTLQQFSKASELLKDESIAARLSGIYLFESIMNKSQEYHWQIIELLTAFVMEKKVNFVLS